jgi:predicted kinase
MCGLPFAGKSTAARALQSRTKAALVQLDAINAERGLGLDGSAIPEQEWSQTYAEAYRRVDALSRKWSGGYSRPWKFHSEGAR